MLQRWATKCVHERKEWLVCTNTWGAVEERKKLKKALEALCTTSLDNYMYSVCGSWRAGSTPAYNKQGSLVTSEKDLEQRWAVHFEEVLNREDPGNPANAQEAMGDLEINSEPLTRIEIMRAIQSLKNGKAIGPDQLNAELFKADPEVATTLLLPLFIKIWEEEQIPSDCKKGNIMAIPKKGNLADCNNIGKASCFSPYPAKHFVRS